jgi:sulfotransferase
MKFHAVSGLPRSGSSLLAGLLRQNPNVLADISSPVVGLARSLINITGSGEMIHRVSAAQKEAMIRSVVTSYYDCVRDDREVIVDTNRQWTANLPLLVDLFPDAKVICCVRDISWIIDSIERLMRRNVYEQTQLFAPGPERATVYGRAESIMKADRLVGGSWTALREGFYSDLSDRLMIVEYDLLAKRPAEVLQAVYSFLEEPMFDGHDFENVQFDAPEFDEMLGVKGLHDVRPKVSFEPRRTILPPDLFKKYQEYSFWRDPVGSAAHVLRSDTAGTSSGLIVSKESD